MGELVKCYVLKDSTSLTFDEIADKLQGRLENYKRPMVYEWIDEIPMTSSGKKQRVNLK
jgi:long-chain acyl-CoA synthetase